MEELKPCPFCGQPPSVIFRDKIIFKGALRIQCTNLKCGVTTYIQGYNKEHLIKQWNQRTPVDDARNIA